MKTEAMNIKEEWRITVKVLERLRDVEGTDPELLICMDAVINSLKTCLEIYQDERD